MKRKTIFLYTISFFVFLLSSCSKQSPSVQDYYPIKENTQYSYEGFGNEYAAYNVVTDYASQNKVQHRINNGGTVQVEVVEVADGKVTRIFRQPETYYRENFLENESNVQEVLLMEPIEEGTSWTLNDGSVRTITGVSEEVTTPSGRYSTISVETENQYGKMIEYYAKDTGLVKRVNIGDGYEISSELSEILNNTLFVQSVRFYYPNINDSKIYYKDKEISFKTNDITGTVLEASYKENFEGKPGDVFSPNTKINSISLNQDGVVNLDLSKEFISEMNAGSEYEAMILQSVANTFGSYYNQNKVLLTIDQKPYTSGHFEFKEGEYLTSDLENVNEIG